MTERLRGLAPQTRDVLLLAAALAQPTVTEVAAAIGDAGQAERCLAEAVAAGVLELDGQRVRFTHPLIASIPYSDLSGDARQALHERLAASVTDPEEHARHAALGSDAPSSVVATALDSAADARPAARQHRRRGRAGPASAQPHAGLSSRRTSCGGR